MTEAIAPESLKPRERLSDEEMGSLLSAVGNHEAKAITLILMRSGNIYDRGGLYEEVLNSQGNNKGWIMNRSMPFKYCFKSLAPIGLVKERLSGYAITEYGKELGIPLAGLLLDFSERHSMPLNLLGSTSSSSESKTIQTKEGKDIEFKKRAPIITLKILYELLASPNPPIRKTDLEERMGSMHGFLDQHLIRLSKLGLIRYSAKEANKPFSSYKLCVVVPEGEVPIFNSNKILAKSVFDIFKSHPEQYLTTRDIYGLLPKEQKEKWKSDKKLRSVIAKISSLLAKHEYVDIEKFNSLRQSEISITDEQGIALTELLEIIRRFQNQDKEILEKGNRLAREIISSPQRVSNLLRRAREASSKASQSSSKETQEHMLSIISSSPNGVTNKEMQKLLEVKYDKFLGIARVSVLSSSLAKEGTIRMEKEGSVNRFFPNNKT